MKVRCLRVLQGGCHDGPEITDSGTLTVGCEYVVLAVWANEVEGAKYAILGNPPFRGSATLWPASMFEITSAVVPRSWRIHQPYTLPSPLLIFEPVALDNAYHEARSSDDPHERGVAIEVWRREVIKMYEEEGESPPQR